MNPTVKTRPSVLRQWLPFLLKLSLITALIAGAVYWLRFSPIAVDSVDVVSAELVADVMGTGTLEARTKAIISPRIAGRLVKVYVDQGDTVEAGQPLLSLDDNELKQQVAMARVSIAVAKAGINRVEADRNQTVAVLTQAETDFTRIQQLVKSNAASASELDRRREHLDVATAGVARADAAIAEARQQELLAESTLSYHEARLADTRVDAPFTGLIVQRYRDPGAIAVPGSPVLSLISTDELWITAWVDETEMSRLAVGQSARVIFRSEVEKTFQGEVKRLGREADRETREFTVDVRVLELPQNWAVGQRADVYIETATQAGTAVLPASAIVWQDQSPGLYLTTDGIARWQPVTLGLKNREFVEVTQGVSIGDRVLLPDVTVKPMIQGRRVVVR